MLIRIALIGPEDQAIEGYDHPIPVREAEFARNVYCSLEQLAHSMISYHLQLAALDNGDRGAERCGEVERGDGYGTTIT